MKEEKPNYVRGTKENNTEWDLKDELEKMTEMEAFVHFRQRPNRSQYLLVVAEWMSCKDRSSLSEEWQEVRMKGN